MRGGQLRIPLVYQVKTQVADSYGQLQDTWVTQGTYYGLVRSPTGREALNAAQMKAEISHIVTTRYPGFMFLPTYRFLLETRVFNILYVLNFEERNRQLDIGCIEVVSPVGT
jgi:SPP1 family predicted phage head-tail adaptor